MKLTSNVVDGIVNYVLATEFTKRATVRVEGLVRAFLFDTDRLVEKKENINQLLLQLPDNFRRDGGGGWTFLQVPFDRDGRQWGEQRDAEALICLGIACNLAKWQGREFQQLLPGGVPYVEIFPNVERAITSPNIEGGASES